MDRLQNDAAGRVGVLIPSTNTAVEADFWSNAPSGVTVHASRMYLEETTVEDERRMLDSYLPTAARDIGTCRPDVVVFGCTSAGSILGEQGEASLVSEIEATTHAPVVSTNTAVLTQLHRRSITRPLVFTPYILELTDSICAGLAHEGIDAVGKISLGIVDPFDIVAVEPATIRDTIKQSDKLAEADGIFISCTNLRTFDVIADLEDYSGLPVVTSNQAALDLALDKLAKAYPERHTV